MRNLLYFKILTFSGYVSQNSRTATEALFLLVVFYLIILLPMSLFIGHLEHRTRRAKYGA